MFPINNSTYSPRQNGGFSAGSSPPDTVSQGLAVPLKTEDYHNIWAEWEKNATPGAAEQRGVAVARLRECLENNKNSIDLAQLHLTSVPDLWPPQLENLCLHENQLCRLPENLPETLTCLKISYNVIREISGNLSSKLQELNLEGNELESIPDNLPNSLEILNVDHNKLSSLPERLPDSLQDLVASRNRLEHIPDNLPNSLKLLAVSENQISSLPRQFPANLCVIDLIENQLRTLPESIWNLPSRIVVEVQENPLTDETLRLLRAASRSMDFIGPRIFFSLSDSDESSESDDSVEEPPQTLIETVPTWLSEPLSVGAAAQWLAIGQEEGAAAFSAFLNRLSKTRNACENPAFKTKVSEWLIRLAATSTLRETTFAVALGATASCEDRVTLTWNDMQKAMLVHDVEHGVWDNKLPELMASGCEMFRLEQLEQVARDKVKTLRFVDEIEVYLAYQTGLKEALKLSSVGDKMRFADVSGVTQEDLNRTLIEINTRENREFPIWLSQWSPWKTALQRANPNLIQRLQAQIATINDSFSQRLEAAIQASGLAGIEGVEVTIGKQIWDEIQRESDTGLTRAFLKARYQALLGDKSPIQALTAVSELVSVASLAPAVAAVAIRPEQIDEEHPSSLLAARVAEGGMAQLAEAWISLLHLLYQDRSLSKTEILSALLPHKIQDRVKSLSHAVAGAAWNSEAATKMSALLCELASDDEGIRQEIMARLALAQNGYSFKELKLQQPADFYQRANYADSLRANNIAKALLKQGNLIPENRALYMMAPATQREISRTEQLAQWIETAGNWSGNFGDYAPGLIANLYPHLRVKINAFNEQGEVTHYSLSGNDRRPPEQFVELNLQHNHYSPVINGEQRSAPGDGDCFFYSFLTALNGVTPSGDEIQQLRNLLAGYIRKNPEVADFIEIQTASDKNINPVNTNKQRIKTPPSGFAILADKIKRQITPQVLAAQAALEREKAELERATKLTRGRPRVVEAKVKAKKRTYASVAADASTEDATLARLKNRSRQQNFAASLQAQRAKRQRDQEDFASWNSPVAMASASSTLPSPQTVGETSTAFSTGRVTTETSRHLAELRAFNEELERHREAERIDRRVAQRLEDLRGSSDQTE